MGALPEIYAALGDDISKEGIISGLRDSWNHTDCLKKYNPIPDLTILKLPEDYGRSPKS
jgi:hypothetical protein